MKSNLIAATLLLAVAAAFALAFASLPIEDNALAIDWKQIWAGTHNFSAHYGSTELRTPPWALPAIWPLTLLPLAASWGLAAFVTLAVLALAVPPSAPSSRWLLGAVALASCYPALRQMADGNLEAWVIGGVLLMLAGARAQNAWLLAAGALLAAAKIQETWLLFIVFGLRIWRAWPRRELLKAAGLALAFAAPFLLWKGGDWLDAMLNFPWPGTAIDSSLAAFSGRTAPWLLWVLWPAVLLLTLWAARRGRGFSQTEAGALAAAGLLLAPYAASNSVLTPLALAAPPLLARRPWLGVALFALANLPYFLLSNTAWRTNGESNYWTFFLLALWAISLWELRSKPVSE